MPLLRADKNRDSSTEIKRKLVQLNDAESIVLTCFKLQKSLSYLDLQISEHAFAKRREESIEAYICEQPFLQKTFFSTDENLRNTLVPERRLLYCLHLDMPERIENSHLSNGRWRDRLSNFFVSFHVEVAIFGFFYRNVVSRIIAEAFNRRTDKLSLLTWRAELGDLYPLNLHHDIKLCFLSQLYLDCKDSNFVTKCVLNLTYFYDLLEMDRPRMFEYFLYHACKSDYSIKTMACSKDLANVCIFATSFRSFRSILNYEDKPYYNELKYHCYKNSARRNRNIYTKRNVERKMSRERRYRLVEILFFFDRRDGVFKDQDVWSSPFSTCNSATSLEFSEALRLIWNSIPDAFVTLQEMKECYTFALDSNEISDVHDYYEDVICQTVPRREPRSLLHYCKTSIRHFLYKNNLWLPDGIEQLKLPPKLQNYLNLEI